MLLEDQGQIVYHFNVDGDPEDMLVTLGFDALTTTAGYADIPQIAWDAWAAHIHPQLPEAFLLTSVDAEVGASPGPGVNRWTYTNGSLPGDVSASMVPQNTAYLIHKRTSAAGRGSQGRMYVPGVAEGNVNNVGVVDSTRRSELQGVFDDLFTDLNTTQGVPLVVNHGPGSPLGLQTPIQRFIVDTMVGTQRRRLRP